MRVLVDQQLVPHAVSRTVIVIQPHLPQRATRKRIQLMPLSPGRELQSNERQKASQHGGVVQALLRIDFPHASVRVASVVPLTYWPPESFR